MFMPSFDQNVFEFNDLFVCPQEIEAHGGQMGRHDPAEIFTVTDPPVVQLGTLFQRGDQFVIQAQRGLSFKDFPEVTTHRFEEHQIAVQSALGRKEDVVGLAGLSYTVLHAYD